MLKEYILRQQKKVLDANGVGDMPEAVEKMLANPEKVPAVLGYVLLSRAGVFNTLGFVFFAQRIMKKFTKKDDTNHANGTGQ
jgi:hypothetical protein